MNIMDKIFCEFDREDIKYAHFKSNTNIEMNYLARSDFDVLIDGASLEDVETILKQNNGIEFRTVREKTYPYVSNWLIFDDESGRLYHLHLHQKLVTGKQFLKDYIIPWDNLILESRIHHEDFEIYVTDPNLEIILLAARAVVKSNINDVINAYKGDYCLHEDLESERKELLSLIDPNIVLDYTKVLFPSDNNNVVYKFCTETTISSELFLELSKIVRDEFNDDRRYSPFVAYLLSNYNHITHWIAVKLVRHFNANLLIKKATPNDGLIIAFVGVDGSGKSSTIRAISKWMSQIDNRQYYLGEGEGNTNLYVKSVKYLLKKMKKGNQNRKAQRDTIESDERRDSSISLMKIIYYYIKISMILSVENSNIKKINSMNSYRSKGGICLTDRYPQNEFPDCNDGPKIQSFSDKLGNNIITEYCVKLEDKYFNRIDGIIPDLIFRLNISAETSMKRKPEQHSISTFIRKIDDLKSISFSGAKIVDIDAENDREQELLEIKKVIWDNIVF